MDLSHSVRKWFYVTDIANSVDTLSRLHTKGISLASDDILYLVNKLKLKEYSWDQGVAPRVRNLIQSDDRDTQVIIVVIKVPLRSNTHYMIKWKRNSKVF